jgi:hypothetical protein
MQLRNEHLGRLYQAASALQTGGRRVRARAFWWAAPGAAGTMLAAVWIRERGLEWDGWSGARCWKYSLVAAFGAALIGVSIHSSPEARVNRALA